MSNGAVEVDEKWRRERRRLYERLDRQIGRTPFVKLEGLSVPGNCQIFAKEEYRNPTGSHYDREMLRFLIALESEKGTAEGSKIVPCVTRMLETTTGNSGSAFAWLCGVLGYPPPTIIIPADMPHARRAQIESFGAKLILSPAGEYISGIVSTYGHTLAEPVLRNEDFYPTRHWADQTHCVDAMRDLGLEILNDAAKQNVELDAFILALGNGSSSRGVGSVMFENDIPVYGMEPAESPIVAEYLGLVEPRTGDRTHGMIGTGPHEQEQIYLNMKHVADLSSTDRPDHNRLLKSIYHPTDTEVKSMKHDLMNRSFKHVGMSSAGSVVAALAHIKAEKLVNSNIGVIFYDPAWKYL